VNIDGGARGNPGPAAIGVVAKEAGKQLFVVNQCIGKATNNVAEYTALICALRKLKNYVPSHKKIELLMDSELVVKQIRGEYRVKDAGLKVLYERAMSYFKLFKDISLVHVPRAKNYAADELVNKALDRKI
jgi:ribonuclease HI